MNPLRKLIPARDIQRRVRELGREIGTHYRGDDVVLLGLMNGALFFLADLARKLPPSMMIQCRSVSSYAGTQSTGKLRGLRSIGPEFKGKTVLIVDDILDTGLTLKKVKERLLEVGAKRVDFCVLLRKEGTQVERIRARWVGFDVPNEWIVGYGMELDGVYRARPDISILVQPPASS